jgi:hypothetical protein
MAQAQASPSVDGRAKHSIVTEVGASTLIGVGLRVGTRTDLILEGGGRLSDGDGPDTRVFVLRPAIKRYLGSTAGSVAPYLLFGLKAEWTRSELGVSTLTTQDIGGTAGLGLEWFPTQRVSVGGNVGVELLAVRRESPSLLIGPDPVSTGYEIGTASSGIRIRLFF